MGPIEQENVGLTLLTSSGLSSDDRIAIILGVTNNLMAQGIDIIKAIGNRVTNRLIIVLPRVEVIGRGATDQAIDQVNGVVPRLTGGVSQVLKHVTELGRGATKWQVIDGVSAVADNLVAKKVADDGSRTRYGIATLPRRETAFGALV